MVFLSTPSIRIDRTMLYFSEIVLDEQIFDRALPVNLKSDHFLHFSGNNTYYCPRLYVYTANNIFLLPDSTVFKWVKPLSLSFPLYKKRIRLHSIKGIFDIRRKWQRVNLAPSPYPYLVIHDQWTSNYYHWVTQALPRLLLAMKTLSEFMLLLPADHLKEFHTSSLKMLGVHDWVSIDVGPIFYKVPRLIYPSHDIQIGDYNDILMRDLSTKLRKTAAKKENAKRKYVFSHRAMRKGRNIVNEHEVLSVFISWNFMIVDFEKLSLQQQIELMSHTVILAGIHGAGLTNMLFMESGSYVLELTSRLKGDQYYYYTLSNALQHKYYYQWCKPDVPDKTIQEANIIVDTNELNMIIKQIVDLINA